MSGKKGMKAYPVELKLEAMRLYYEEGKTRAEVTKLLGIRDPHAVKEWERSIDVKEQVRSGKSKDVRARVKTSKQNWNACAWRMLC